jgi:hypothetical protein
MVISHAMFLLVYHRLVAEWKTTPWRLDARFEQDWTPRACLWCRSDQSPIAIGRLDRRQMIDKLTRVADHVTRSLLHQTHTIIAAAAAADSS